MADGNQRFREIKRHHHTHPTDECALMSQAEAMAHVAAELAEQNELLAERNAMLEEQTDVLRTLLDTLDEIETNTRRV